MSKFAKRVSTYISEENAIELDAICRRLELTQSELLRRMINQSIDFLKGKKNK